ncbi:fibronectin type III domain-containing protein [Formosa maritima]|uniref:Fibronectin type-III domain-containing protein n=1 Tax=Formosa maritima TaxID=2592046 RepID=A0A5D0G911_9FLAO|nr:fibronectin type III domain-containing protein [Formosa maritima]TYA54819.1 hypothetical protein FVF61_08595 [Formosa maritima]
MKKIILLFSVTLFVFSCSSDDSNDSDDTITCNSPTNISTNSITEDSATINWTSANDSNTFQIEYGTTGFTQGQGQTITSSNSNSILTNLNSDTSYQYYIRANCANNSYSSWVGPQNFTTSAINCPEAQSLNTYNITETSANIEWSYIGTVTPTSWKIEYGIIGFTLGQGTIITTSNQGYDLTGLTPSTQYDFYITAQCSDTNFGDTVGPSTFITEAACQQPTLLNLNSVEVCSISFDWYTNGETSFEIEYGESGFTLGTGNTINTSNSYYEIDTNLDQGTTYEIYVRANCGSDGYSEYSDALVVTTDSNDLTGMYDVTVTRDDGATYSHGLETIILVSPNYYKTETTGLWAIGAVAPDQGFNFANSCNEIIIPNQQLCQGYYANNVFGTQNGEVLPNGDLYMEYMIEFDSGDRIFQAFYEKQ